MTVINRVVLVGNLTRDVELRTTQGGTSVAEFGLAVNGREKVNEQWQDRADFFDVKVFGRTADACAQYLSKGAQVAVDGRLRQDRWQDKDTRENRSKIRIIGDNVEFLRTRIDGQEAAEQADPPSSFEQPDEIPF